MSKQTIEIPIKLVIDVDFKTPKAEVAKESTIPTKKALSDYSWAEIAQISKSGKALETFSLYDTKTEKLKSGEIVTLVIIGFNHDKISNSNTLAGITFGVKGLLNESMVMNDEWTNVGGWNKSKMRKYLQEIYNEQLSAALKKAIVAVDKTTSIGNESTEIETTSDTLFLLSEIEVQGKQEYSIKGEGKQYPYFSEKHCKNKYKNDENCSSWWWWLRSPFGGCSGGFCGVGSGGGSDCGSANYEGGVSFHFCI